MTAQAHTLFDASSTAEQVAAGCDLRGKLVVLTGSSAGIGRETARVLAAAGADLFLGLRNPGAAGAVIEVAAGVRAPVFHRLDLMDEQSVDGFADAVLRLGRPVDILINNAAIMNCPLARDAHGIESQLSTNFIGHAILTSRLAEALRRSPYSRLVSLTSLAHQRSDVMLDDMDFECRDYEPLLAYGQSKTASVLLAVHVQAALGGSAFDAFAVHPGVILSTDLMRYMSEDERAAALARSTVPVSRRKTIAMGAATTIWAATAPELTGKGGVYLEDCHIARTLSAPSGPDGVMDYALDPASAARLWRWTEERLGRKLPL